MGLLIEASVIVDDVEHRQIVPQTYIIVVYVVGRGNLEAACSEIHLHIRVLYNRNFLIYKRYKHLLALEPVVSLICRIYADCGIGHNGFRPCGRNHNVLVSGIALAVRNEIAHMVELAGGVLVHYFLVAHSRESNRIPVHHTHTLINVPFLIEIYKGVDNCLAQIRVHSEFGPVPVAGCTEFAELRKYDSAVLFLPFPGVLEEFFPGKVFLAYALSLQFGHDLAFGGDGRMVRTGYPAGILAVHSGLADEHIVDCVVQNVSHMQDSRDIWRRYNYGIRFPLIGLRVEKIVFQPIGVPFVFG